MSGGLAADGRGFVLIQHKDGKPVSALKILYSEARDGVFWPNGEYYLNQTRAHEDKHITCDGELPFTQSWEYRDVLGSMHSR
jgi:hypothetical protein